MRPTVCADENYCRTIVLNRSEQHLGSLERVRPLEKCELTWIRCPSEERLGTTLGTTVLHFLSARPLSHESHPADATHFLESHPADATHDWGIGVQRFQ